MSYKCIAQLSGARGGVGYKMMCWVATMSLWDGQFIEIFPERNFNFNSGLK